jgi:hypothetical protein
MFFHFWIDGCEDEDGRQANRKRLEKAFRREAPDASDIQSETQQVGKGPGFLAYLNPLNIFGGPLPTVEEVHIKAHLRSRAVETIVNIGVGTSGAVVTIVDFLAHIEKTIPCETRVKKTGYLGFAKYEFVAEDPEWAKRLNQNGRLLAALRLALRDTYRAGNERVKIAESFVLSPQKDGLQVWLRSTLHPMWWTFGLFAELGVEDFLNVLETTDQAL